MNNDVLDNYSKILSSFLGGSGENALEEGYMFGRNAIASKLNIFEITEIHHLALAKILTLHQFQKGELSKLIARANELLAASLGSFEMTHRGYQETVAQLQSVNKELQSQKEILASTNKELEAFSYTVSHDLQAPLRAIKGFSEILLGEFGSSMNERCKTLLTRVIIGVRRMEHLITGLLGFSRFSHQPINRDFVDLTEIANKVFKDLQTDNPDRAVTTEVAPELSAMGDFQLLNVVITNLISNAWKYTSNQPFARIEVGRLSALDNAFFVRDNGTGFDMKYVNRLFTPFERLHSGDQYEGSGIGLATVRRIIARHGGKVWAESKPGEGSSFYFSVPK